MLSFDASNHVSQVQDSYLDPNSLNSIKAMGREKDPQALKEIAKKFEGMFVQQMLKTMRQANEAFSDGNMFDSQTTRFHRDMLDQQMVINLTSGKGIGLADHFYQQMMQNYGAGMRKESSPEANQNLGELADAVQYRKATQQEIDTDNTAAVDSLIEDFMRMSDNSLGMALAGDEPEYTQPPMYPSAYQAPYYSTVPALLSKPQAVTYRGGQKSSISESQENFVMMLKPHAEKAAAELQINPDVLIAQVALETGWGKHVIHDKQGANSFNLFNIKATGQWQGDKVNVSTLEYRDGIAANEKADFRKYADYAESFSDYVRLMKNNPRYERALEAGANSSAYADALQSAGYATDPQYAKKIKQLLNSDLLKSMGDLSSLSLAASGRQLLE